MIDLAMAGVADEDDGGIASGREDPNVGAVAGAVKRRGLASEYAQEKAVVFEASDGGALEDDDKVKHYDADGMFDIFPLQYAWLICSPFSLF